jgi:uncharacterized protein (TIGR02246 family)
MRSSICLGIATLVLAAIGFILAEDSPTTNRGKAAIEGPAFKSAVEYGRTKDDAPDVDQRSPDEEAIRGTAETFARAYAKGDAKAAASHFTHDAEYIDEQGTRYEGRDAIERNFARFFADNKGLCFEIQIESIRFPDPSIAVEDGTSAIVNCDGEQRGRSRYLAVHLKTGGKWLVAMVREQPPQGERRHRQELEQLEWLLGEWVDEADDSIVTFTCRPIDDGNFLVREFRVTVAGDEVISGSQRIGWDPLTGRLRAWTFDSQGGHFEGVWWRDGESWVLSSTGVTADGETASGTSVFTIVDPHTITWQAVDHEVEGIRKPDSETYTLVRMGPAPEVQKEHREEAKK